MASKFSKRRDSLLSQREKGIGESTPSPARAVEKTSLTAAPVSSEEATMTPATTTPEEASAPLVTRTDRRKGKQAVGSSSRGKRSLEEAEEEGTPNKRQAYESRLPTVEEEEDDQPLAVVHRTPTSSRGHGSSSAQAADFPWTQEGFKVPKSKRDLFKLSQDIQKATPPLKNLMISDPIIGKYFGGAVLSRALDSDTLDRAKSHSYGVEDSIGNIGALLSQVSIYCYHYF